jgi:hypothetical protein
MPDRPGFYASLHINVHVYWMLISDYCIFRHARSSQSGIHVLSKMDSRLRTAGMTAYN